MSGRRSDLLTEPLLSLPQIAALLPPQRAGRPVHPETIKNWIRNGTRLPDGTRLRLEAVRVGSRWLSDRTRVARFIEAQTRAAENSILRASSAPSRSCECPETGNSVAGSV
jgi:hypothetical protein